MDNSRNKMNFTSLYKLNLVPKRNKSFKERSTKLAVLCKNKIVDETCWLVFSRMTAINTNKDSEVSATKVVLKSVNPSQNVLSVTNKIVPI